MFLYCASIRTDFFCLSELSLFIAFLNFQVCVGTLSEATTADAGTEEQSEDNEQLVAGSPSTIPLVDLLSASMGPLLVFRSRNTGRAKTGRKSSKRRLLKGLFFGR